ncbi:MAG: protein kinase [Acidobacteriota bacterium]|nr:protein kinase [Acidobacteriota bacterium]
MTLSAGSRLGPYEILSPLGAGGMGEVYRARDTRIGRDVAIKVLPVEFAADGDRLARFRREAQVLGSLNHPHIGAIYGLEESGGVDALVLELVEGETLEERLAAGPLPVDEALAIARQIAEALEAAHERGIVHRDLKPANVKLLADGTVKVLDFGLAKAVAAEQSSSDLANSPTLTVANTQAGAVIGTAAYMSPEQARGKAVDRRADVWAFGAVLYEMLTGRRAFEGETASDILAAILMREPDLASLPSATPASVRELIARCLRRDPRSRQRDVGDARVILEEAATLSPSVAAAPRDDPGSRRSRAPLLAIVATAAALLGGLGVFLLRAPKPQRAAAWHRLTFASGTVLSAGFLPDGKVVYSAAWNGAAPAVYSTRTDFSESREIVPAPSKLLAVSKSGEMAVLLRAKPLEWFAMEGTLARIPADGGAPRELQERIRDATWSPDGSQLAIVRRIEQKVRLEFPPGRVLYETVGEISHPRFSQEGDRIAFLDYPAKGGHWGTVSVVDLKGRKTVWSRIYEEIDGLLWSPSGEELWFGGEGERSAIQLFATGPDRKPRLLTAAPGDLTPLAVDPEGRVLVNRLSVRAQIVCALPGDSRPRDVAYLGASLLADLSSDGKKILFGYRGPGAQENYDVIVRSTDGGSFVRLGRGDAKSFSPDGKWVTGVLWGNADFGAGSAGADVPTDSVVVMPTAAGEPRSIGVGNLWIVRGVALHPDGRRLVFEAAERGKPERLWIRDLDSNAAPRPISPPGFYVYTSGFLSPDGRWAVAADINDALWRIPVEGGEPKPIPGVEAGEAFAGWTGDGRSVHVSRYSEKLQIHRIDLATEARRLWKESYLPDSAGAQKPYAVVVARDADTWAAGYQSLLGELYLVEGVK